MAPSAAPNVLRTGGGLLRCRTSLPPFKCKDVIHHIVQPCIDQPVIRHGAVRRLQGDTQRHGRDARLAREAGEGWPRIVNLRRRVGADMWQLGHQRPASRVRLAGLPRWVPVATAACRAPSPAPSSSTTLKCMPPSSPGYRGAFVLICRALNALPPRPSSGETTAAPDPAIRGQPSSTGAHSPVEGRSGRTDQNIGSRLYPFSQPRRGRVVGPAGPQSPPRAEPSR